MNIAYLRWEVSPDREEKSEKYVLYKSSTFTAMVLFIQSLLGYVEDGRSPTGVNDSNIVLNLLL